MVLEELKQLQEYLRPEYQLIVLEGMKGKILFKDRLFDQASEVIADPFVFVLSPLREFSSTFRCKVCSAAGGNIKKLEILPWLHVQRAKSTEQ